MLAYYLSMIESEDDKKKFEKIYYKYRRLMYRISYFILKDVHIAEDVVQTSFLHVIPHLHKFNEEECHKTRRYLIRVVRNESFAVYNKRKNESFVNIDSMEHEIEIGGNLENEAITNIEVEIMSNKMEELSENYKEVLRYRYFDYYSDDKIAKILNITKENVRKRIERARKALIKICDVGGGIDD